MKKLLTITSITLLIFLLSCSEKSELNQKSELELKMDNVAEEYVKLVLEIGMYQPGYVDAYYGPEKLKPAVNTVQEADSTIAASLNQKADELLNRLDEMSYHNATKQETLRYRFLYKQLLAVKGMIAIIAGTVFPFDEESKILYDAEPLHFTDEHFNKILKKLDELLPGEGDLSERWTSFRDKFIIPTEKLDTVFTTAISECRKRTLAHIKLPAEEKFIVEYVTNKPWGAYNWYKGNSFSVIQVNTDLPVYIDRAIDLAAHEGYPGHHVYNTLLEEKLTKKRGWIEFSVYPLNSPMSFIAEGTANYGKKIIFTDKERLKFEKNTLFPLAGLDSSYADEYYNALKLLDELDFAQNEAARNYLDGNWNKEKTERYLIEYAMHSKERAEKKIQFIEQYRSYLINYNLGERTIEEYIERNGGNDVNTEKRWQVFEKLLTTPQTASGLK